ncbi:replication protein A 70 kDa DNA-binding subunit C-like protein [Tanacetum coccineum]
MFIFDFQLQKYLCKEVAFDNICKTLIIMHLAFQNVELLCRAAQYLFSSFLKSSHPCQSSVILDLTLKKIHVRVAFILIQYGLSALPWPSSFFCETVLKTSFFDPTGKSREMDAALRLLADLVVGQWLAVDLLIHHNRQVIPDNTQVKAKEKMSTESVGTKPDRKAAGMDESSPMKPQEKLSTKSGVTKSYSQGIGMAESSHTTPPKKMSIKSGGTNSDSKAVGMAESSQTKPHLFLDELEVDVTGTIVVMIGRLWDVNVGNMIHNSAKASIAHNFLGLKEGDIYLINNFVVLPNKDEYRIFKHDKIMLEFDGETTVRKVFVNGLGFLRYPFQLIEFDRIEPANNKYLIDVTGYVTDVGRTNYTKTGSRNLDFYLANQRGQSLRVTLWGRLGDALIERKIKHVGMRVIVLTLVSPKTYNNKLYLSSTSSTIVYDNDDIPCVQELKTSESCVGQKKEGLDIDSSRPREETLENLLILAWNRKNDTAIFHLYGIVYPRPAVFTMQLLKCSAESLLGAEEDEDDESSLPTAIRNLIGTSHVLEIKSHTYYEYGTFESFTLWKVNPSEMVADGASSSSVTTVKLRLTTIIAFIMSLTKTMLVELVWC